jgi:nucleolar protein 4
MESLKVLTEGKNDEPLVDVLYVSHKAARAALKELQGARFRGRSLDCKLKTRALAVQEVAEDPARVAAKAKRSRLIVRNIPFHATAEQLRELFSRCGNVVDVTLPKRSDGKAPGFAFVQFESVLDAGKAVAELNQSKLGGRPIAVDWAVAKKKYAELTSSSAAAAGATEASGDDGDSGAEMAPTPSAESNEPDIHSDSDDGDDTGDSSDDEHVDTDASDRKPSRQALSVAEDEDGRTVFVSNVAFASTEESLREVFCKFGRLAYVRLVKDKETGASRGTAFVRFCRPEDAQACLAHATSEADRTSQALGESTGAALWCDGRLLQCMLAVSKDKAMTRSEVKRAEKERKVDKRRLYLAREGDIDPRSEAWNDLSETDRAKRLKAEKEKREKLKNPNYIVSDTRLSVRNLPLKADESKLKEVRRRRWRNVWW